MGDPGKQPPASGKKVATEPTLAACPAPRPAPAEGEPAATPGSPPAETAEALGETASGEASALPPEEADGLIGQTLAERYTVLGRLGAGGMSVVFLARHELLQKLVAVKLLRRDIAGSSASLTRFHREALAAASIGHPHIVDVTDYGFTEEGEAFLVMERLEGRDLRQTLAVEGALAPGRAVSIARQILRALTAAHARGIVHRDLKAENVFLCQREGNDFVKLLDFGISKILQPLDGVGSTATTGTGVVMGTPQYIAPEQAHGAPDVDHRVDLYSLGIILYEMLTGSLPFTGQSALEVLMKHVQEAPEPPRQRRPDLAIPAELERVVLGALIKDPAERYPSAEAMLAALPDPLSLPGGFGSGLLPPTALRRNRRWLPATLAAAALVLAGGAFLIFNGRRQQASTPISKPPLAAMRRAADARPPDRKPAAVRITIQATPAGARIWLGQNDLGAGTVTTALPRGQIPVAFTVRAPGFLTRVLEVLPNADRQLGVELQPEPRRPAPIKARKKHSGPLKTTPHDLKRSPYR